MIKTTDTNMNSSLMQIGIKIEMLEDMSVCLMVLISVYLDVKDGIAE